MPYSKYSPKQKKLAAIAPPRKKITKADLVKARKLAKGRGKGKAMVRRKSIKIRKEK
jgi:hypothetical protein